MQPLDPTCFSNHACKLCPCTVSQALSYPCRLLLLSHSQHCLLITPCLFTLRFLCSISTQPIVGCTSLIYWLAIYRPIECVTNASAGAVELDSLLSSYFYSEDETFSHRLTLPLIVSQRLYRGLRPITVSNFSAATGVLVLGNGALTAVKCIDMLTHSQQ